MASEARPLVADDLALLERVAARVADLRLEVPALLTLETAAPLALVAGQTLVFFEPFVAAMLRLPDYRRFARLVERREALERLATLIEQHAEARRMRHRAERDARRSVPPPARTPRP